MVSANVISAHSSYIVRFQVQKNVVGFLCLRKVKELHNLIAQNVLCSFCFRLNDRLPKLGRRTWRSINIV